MEALSGVKGENSVKIFGPDLDELERLADETKKHPATRSTAMHDVGVYHIKGQTNLEFPIDRDKCAAWNVNVSDVQNVLATGRRRQSVHADDRRGENVRHCPALARAAAARRKTKSSTFRSK